MAKRLQEMTLEELWELFPIVLAPHNPRWREWAAEEMDSLGKLLAGFNPAMHHVGSTALPDIQAKPIVDILVEVAGNVAWSTVRAIMEAQGYICMAQTECRLSFNKGYAPEGYAERVFHIHFRRAGDNDELLFRDYLLANPEAAKAYERLKLSLLPAFRNDRDGYTRAKTAFVNRILAKAREKTVTSKGNSQ